MRSNRTFTALIALLAVAAVGTPAAAQAPPRPLPDLRSADARDADRLPGAAQLGTTDDPQDRRSPDAVDGADGRATTDVAPTVLELGSSDGFDWSSAAIGAFAAIGMTAILFASAITMRRRHTRVRHTAFH
jgi:hypothetical protein